MSPHAGEYQSAPAVQHEPVAEQSPQQSDDRFHEARQPVSRPFLCKQRAVAIQTISHVFNTSETFVVYRAVHSRRATGDVDLLVYEAWTKTRPPSVV